jgi:hypothetical protein
VFYPTLRWFFLPSGGAIKPGFWGVVDGIRRIPILAHPGGGALIALFYDRVFHVSPFVMVCTVLLAEGVNQFHKTHAGVYGRYAVPNVLWRIVMAVIGAGVAFTLLH